MSKINNYLQKYCIFIFGIITFILLFLREPFFDETHAFDIACLKINEILYLTRIEGHSFLWYFTIKPFTFFNSFPYSILFLNWLFCVLSINILWKKAPFSPLTKTFITFSTPFLLYFAIVARCYSIGILFLFLVCALYPKRFKKPYLFSFLILLCANTNLMMCVGCFYLSLIYIFELVKRCQNKLISKSKLIKIFLILFLCALLILLQYINFERPDKGDSFYFLNQLSFYLIPIGKNLFSFIYRILIAIMLYYSIFYLFKNSKKALFFTLSTFLTLTFIFIQFYSGHYWVYYSYFIYFIATFWIFKKTFKKSKLLNILFILIVFFSLIPFSIFEDGKISYIFSSNAKEISQIIKNEQIFKNKKLYDIYWWSDIHPGATRYLANKVIIFDRNNQNRLNFESQKNIFKMKKETIDFNYLVNLSNENTLIITCKDILKNNFKNLSVTKENNNYIFKTKEKTYLLKEVYSKKLKKEEAYFKAYKILEN